MLFITFITLAHPVSAATLGTNESDLLSISMLANSTFQPIIVPSDDTPAVNWTSGAKIPELNSQVLYWYRFIRNYIAVPFMILSFASCGFQFLNCAFMGKPDFALDSTKKQLITTISAMIFLFALPAIMAAVKNIVESTAWTPPQIGTP